MFSVHFDAKEPIANIVGTLTRVTRDALNRAGRKGAEVAVNTTVSQLNLQRGYTQGLFRVVPATTDRPAVEIRARVRPIQVRNFGAQQEFDAGHPAGVSVQVARNGGRKTIRSAFFARLKQGGRGVFRRVPGARRYPIEVLYGPSPDQVFVRIRPELSDTLLADVASAVSAGMRGA